MTITFSRIVNNSLKTLLYLTIIWASISIWGIIIITFFIINFYSISSFRSSNFRSNIEVTCSFNNINLICRRNSNIFNRIKVRMINFLFYIIFSFYKQSEIGITSTNCVIYLSFIYFILFKSIWSIIVCISIKNIMYNLFIIYICIIVSFVNFDYIYLYNFAILFKDNI